MNKLLLLLPFIISLGISGCGSGEGDLHAAGNGGSYCPGGHLVCQILGRGIIPLVGE